MKTTSGRPYIIPTGRPYQHLVKDNIEMKFFYENGRYTLYQTIGEQLQRLILKGDEIDNFLSRCREAGFKTKVGTL